MYTVYAIKSRNHNYIYVGLTDCLERRLSQHNGKHATATQFYAPFDLFFSETYPTRVEARIREKYLKGGSGKEFLKKKLAEL
ncbi:MAG: GIY-YIG nuclease family protein [candidate division SR1 bacterium]|nr:GIY-YIG nuclease family protein [candidate division SR1 bacterium]